MKESKDYEITYNYDDKRKIATARATASEVNAAMKSEKRKFRVRFLKINAFVFTKSYVG